MKTLETGKLYVKDIFNKARFYRIPEYQRPYVWGTKQITELLNDISTAMEEDKDREYFLGCMIWNVVEEHQRGYQFKVQDILDGQQRFITLFLLHAVLRDLSVDAHLGTKVADRLMQQEDRYDNVPARNRVIFAIRADKTFLDQHVLNSGATNNIDEITRVARDDDETVSVRSMAHAIIDMHEWWRQRLAEKPDDIRDEYVAEFFSYLSNKVLALFLATPDNLDDAYNLFTVLNSRGMQLRAGDILRAQNLRRVEGDERRRELSQEWDSYVDGVREPLGSFDELLKYIVLAKVRFTSDKTRSLNVGFDYLVERGAITPGEGFFRLVGRYAQHFASLTNPKKMDLPDSDHTDFENLFFILSETFGSQFLMPLLHYREQFGDPGIFEFLVKLDNLVSMAWLLGRRTLMQRLFLLVRRMDECAALDLPVAARVETFLADETLRYDHEYQTSKTAMRLDEFRVLLDEEHWGAFGGTRLNKPRYLLLKLDLLHCNNQTRLSFNGAASSVEHLLPRRPRDGGEADNAEWHQHWVHRLGNLVLLDRKKNSSLSNAAFSEKRIRYQTAFEARPYTNSVFLRHDAWPPSSLIRQHEYVIDTLMEYYRQNSVAGLRALRSRKQAPLIGTAV